MKDNKVFYILFVFGLAYSLWFPTTAAGKCTGEALKRRGDEYSFRLALCERFKSRYSCNKVTEAEKEYTKVLAQCSKLSQHNIKD